MPKLPPAPTPPTPTSPTDMPNLPTICLNRIFSNNDVASYIGHGR